MNLLDLQQRPGIALGVGRIQRRQESSAIALNVVLGVVLSEAEVQRLAAVAGGNATLPSAESVHQPGQRGEDRSAEDLQRPAW